MTLPSDTALCTAVMRLIGTQPDCGIEARDTYALLEAQFPGLVPEETRVPYGSDESHFRNRVRWAVEHLRASNWISRIAGHGRWELTAKGRAGWKDAFPTGDELLAELGKDPQRNDDRKE